MMFPDGAPVMLASEASLELLNQQFTEEKLDMGRFRPNIIVSGCSAYEEVIFPDFYYLFA